MANKIPEVSLDDFVHDNYKKYTLLTVEDRSLPDMGDGLKPSTRRALYSLYTILKESTRYVKSARAVGDCLGKYHPHGDAGLYKVIATDVSRSPLPLYEGLGNWGSLIDPPAAMRYTEVTISQYGRTFLNPEYMHPSVTTYVPNYDGSDVEPTQLPALLPHVLLNGPSGVAVGVSCGFIPFTVDSVCTMLEKWFKSKGKMTIRDFASTLKPSLRYGGTLIRDDQNKQQWLQMFETGRATIRFESVLDIDDKAKIITIDNWPPDSKIDKVIDTIRAHPKVRLVEAVGDGTTVEVRVMRGCPQSEFDKIVDFVADATVTSISAIPHMIDRDILFQDGLDKTVVELVHISPVDYMNRWTRYRVDLETRMLTHRKNVLEERARHLELLIYATTILDVIRAAWDAKDFVKHVVNNSKLNVEDATYLSKFQIIRLSKLDKREHQEKLKQVNNELRLTNQGLKQPVLRVEQEVLKLIRSLKKVKP